MAPARNINEGVLELACAHMESTPSGPRRHLLRDHLKSVAEKASQFAQSFAGSEQAYIAGFWHDLGKYGADFQAYLRQNADAAWSETARSGRRVDHSSAGALLVRERYGNDGWPAAFAIAGHHCGLQDYQDLKTRLASKHDRLDVAMSSPMFEVDAVASGPTMQPRHAAESASAQEAVLDVELFTRMIFSALVDADFLDTEAFFDCERASLRQRRYDFAQLSASLDSYLASLNDPRASPEVQKVRDAVLCDARTAANLQPGLFTLTAPTGSGKTLSALAFAVDHVKKNALERIIVVAPFTSIIDQTAQEYRKALGSHADSAIIEHHSALDPVMMTTRNALATENWDAPIIVTSAVQFFESLFARRSSRCRKLHRITRSAIVIDEVQTLPIRLLQPILNVLSHLVQYYGSSLILSTATQPALVDNVHAKNRAGLTLLKGATEIVSESELAYRILVRAHIALPASLDKPESWEAIAERINTEPQVLAIVSKRDDARILAGLVSDGIHLSAAMCPQHRMHVLKDIRFKLGSHLPCRVVSTQLVEAGVDIDFPIVLRALAGIDSIVQAAGRCNRVGQSECGRVEVFVPPSRPVPDLRHAYETSKIMLDGQREVSLSDPQLVTDFFDRLYAKRNTDISHIQDARASLRFEEVAQNFKMIPAGSVDIIIPYDAHCRKLIDGLRFGRAGRQLMRGLQRYTVSVFPQEASELSKNDALENVGSQLVLRDMEYYDPRLGLARPATAGEEDFII